MVRRLVLLAVSIAGVACGLSQPSRAEVTAAAPSEGGPALRRATAWKAPSKARAEGALARREAEVERLFEEAGVRFPPASAFLRAFKKERALEVFAASDVGAPLSHITTYGFCAASGRLGPKRREGDRQVPEGFYRLGYFNAKSKFHLSMWVNYPNAADRKHANPTKPGGEIMIHGGCESTGCIALSDQRIEELWVITRSVPGPVDVHIFPSRDPASLSGDEALRAFWENLAEGKAHFDRDRRVPKVRVDSDGRYSFEPG